MVRVFIVKSMENYTSEQTI